MRPLLQDIVFPVVLLLNLYLQYEGPSSLEFDVGSVFSLLYFVTTPFDLILVTFMQKESALITKDLFVRYALRSFTAFFVKAGFCSVFLILIWQGFMMDS